MAFQTTTASLRLPPLPYSENALEPMISARTLSFHHGEDHRSCVETLNKLIADTDLAELSLDELVTRTARKTERVAVFNNAAQAWNHSFYWRCLKPKGGGQPPQALKQKMEATYGSVEACKRHLADSAVTHNLPRQRTLGLADFANSRPLLRFAICFLRESLQKAQATIRATGVRLERGFADFADVPYQDARTQQQLSQLLDECSFSCQMEYSTQPSNVSMCAANDRGSCRRCGERIW